MMWSAGGVLAQDASVDIDLGQLFDYLQDRDEERNEDQLPSCGSCFTNIGCKYTGGKGICMCAHQLGQKPVRPGDFFTPHAGGLYTTQEEGIFLCQVQH